MVKKLLQENGSVCDAKDTLCVFFYADNFFFIYNESVIDFCFGQRLVKTKSSKKQ